MTDAEKLAENMLRAIEADSLATEGAFSLLGPQTETAEMFMLAMRLGHRHALAAAGAVLDRWKEERGDAEHVWCHQPGPPCPRCGETHCHWHAGKADDPKMGGAP